MLAARVAAIKVSAVKDKGALIIYLVVRIEHRVELSKGGWRLTFSFKHSLQSYLARFLTGVLILFVVFEAVSLACRLIIPFFPSVSNGSGKSVVFSLLNSETWLFFSSAAIASIFALIWMFSWVIWPLSVLLRFFGKRERDGSNLCDRGMLLKEFVKTGRSGFDRAFRCRAR
jgi:hypothetical protein